MNDSRYDILFEPINIGSAAAHNRFYKVPHCNGLGHGHLKTEARMREVKIESDWAVASAQEKSTFTQALISLLLLKVGLG